MTCASTGPGEDRSHLEPGPCPPSGAVPVLVGVQLLLVLDTTVITSATPVMSQQLHTGVSQVSLAQGAYALVFGGLLLLGGWCTDRFGALRVLRWALLGFALAGGVVMVVSTVGPVIGLRSVQGLCAALAAPASLALLIDLPQRDRRRGLGWFAAVGAIGLALGVGLGTPLIASMGWRAGFTAPAALALALLVSTAPQGRPATGGQRPAGGVKGAEVRPLLRLSGAVVALLAAAETALLTGAWWPPLVALAVTTPLLALVLRADASGPRPAIPPAMSAATVTRSGLVLMAAFGGWQAAEVLLISVRLDPLRTGTPWLAGLPFWLQGSAALLCAPVVQRLCRAPGTTRLITVASPLLAGAGFIAVGAGHRTEIVVACAAGIIFGIAAVSASTAATLTTTAVPGAPPGRVGAVMTSARQLGTSVGSCVVGALLAAPTDSPGRVCGLAMGAAAGVLGLVLLRLAGPGGPQALEGVPAAPPPSGQ